MKKQSVVINGRFLTRGLTGVERVAAEVTRALVQNHSDQFMFKISMPKTADRTQAIEFARDLDIPVQFGKTKGHIWEQFELPCRARGAVLLSLCNLGPVLKRKQLVTIHDAQVFIVPASYSVAFRKAYHILLPLLGRRAAKIVTISEFSAKALAQYNVTQKALIIPNAADHMDRIEPEFDNIPSAPYALAFGSAAAHKNLKLLKSIFTETPNLPLLALAGGGAANLVGSGDETGDATQITHLGRVSDGQLAGLLQNAQMLLFPSLTEGFGMPPLEAMRLGCPVIASTGGAVPEACGDAAILLDPHDKPAWAAAISELTQNDDKRAAMAIAGRAHAARWTWADAAGAYARALGDIAGQVR